MPTTTAKVTRGKRAAAPDAEAPAPLRQQLAAALASLEALGTARGRAGLARYGIVTSDRVFGVSMGDIQKLAKQLGRSHQLAAALWGTGCYEARMLAVFVAEPERVTAAQMDRWCADL